MREMPLRKWIAIVAAIAVAMIVWAWSSRHDDQPKFFPSARPLTVSPSNAITYPFLASRLVQDDKMWFHIFGPGAHNGTYLLDLKNRKVLGELRYGAPCFFD